MVISTTNDSAYALAADLRAAGVKVEPVDARLQLTEQPPQLSKPAPGC